MNPSAAVDFYSASQDRLNDSANGLHLTMPFPMRNHIAAAMQAPNGYFYFHFGTGLYAPGDIVLLISRDSHHSCTLTSF